MDSAKIGPGAALKTRPSMKAIPKVVIKVVM
jgi:hypothetical protein